MADFKEYDGVKPRMRTHNIHIDNRAKMNITGVSDIESFHEQEVLLETAAGPLRIEGENLHLTKLNLDDGQVVIEGEIIAMEYEEATTARPGFLARMFR